MVDLELDLDAARVERAKRRADDGWVPPVLRFAGEAFTLPDEMPADVMYGIIDGEERQALRVLLAADFDRFWALGPTRDDIPALLTWVVAVYNRPVNGAASAAGPKPKASRPSKRTGG